eukprot:1805190-Prymnesium_polylepis.2
MGDVLEKIERRHHRFGRRFAGAILVVVRVVRRSVSQPRAFGLIRSISCCGVPAADSKPADCTVRQARHEEAEDLHIAHAACEALEPWLRVRRLCQPAAKLLRGCGFKHDNSRLRVVRRASAN